MLAHGGPFRNVPQYGSENMITVFGKGWNISKIKEKFFLKKK
jgi:hypothetical protein